MKMDIYSVVLLLVMAGVGCLCLDIGFGRKQTMTLSPGRIKAYQYFTDLRYKNEDHEIIMDIYSEKPPFGLQECLIQCHRHNQHNQQKCVAVNYCNSLKVCRLRGDATEINIRKSYQRCILLSSALMPGVNEDQIVERNTNWVHFVDHEHYQTLVHNGGTCKFKISNGIMKEYFFHIGWLYNLPAGEIIQDIYTRNFRLIDCLSHCHQHNQSNEHKCIAVNYCERPNNCHLDSDQPQARTGQVSCRCILLSSGIGPGLNANHLVIKNDNWEHFLDNDFYRTSVDDYEIE